MASIECPKCGKEVSESSRFCNNCGHAFLAADDVVELGRESNEQVSTITDKKTKGRRKKELHCTNCGAPLNNFKRCDNCGIKAYNKAWKYCRYCGKETASSSNKCQFCGKKRKSSVIERIFRFIFVSTALSFISKNVKALITYNDQDVSSIVLIAILSTSILLALLYRRLNFISRFHKKSFVIPLKVIVGFVIVCALLFSSVALGVNTFPDGSYFDDARWGMSVEEVQQFSNRRIQQEAPYIDEDTGEAVFSTIAYDLPYAKGKLGSVQYTFDKNNKLEKVTILYMTPKESVYLLIKSNLETRGWKLVDNGGWDYISIETCEYTYENNLVSLTKSSSSISVVYTPIN